MKFSQKLKTLREAKGYTQDEIASKLNIARQSVSKWEQGINEPDFETTKRLCQILDCSLAELIDDDCEIVTTAEEKNERTSLTLFKMNLIVLIMGALVILAFPALASDEIIVHWDANFEPQLGSKWYLLLNLIPVVIGLIVALGTRFFFLKKKAYAPYKKTMQGFSLGLGIALVIAGVVISSLMIAGHNKGNYALMNLTPVVALSLLCAAGPFAHPKFNKRNPMFGFRTAFTISNEEAWNKINAFASITLTAATLIGYVLILVFIEYEWAMLFILVLLLMMVPSFIYHEILRHKAQK